MSILCFTRPPPCFFIIQDKEGFLNPNYRYKKCKKFLNWLNDEEKRRQSSAAPVESRRHCSSILVRSGSRGPA
ncbi:hypothetical protein BACCAP_03417 [Pseudoflavonifractor capillosus ATCC 29799]|uniref:Uncharacterized protein n=1 Tax=Pseudoflavonifractor capillosus ATCC 29799 TaxID=411467 RepID=A6NYW5_9FIRM|nr:hypothetical protein BACCAP_03417 [Pseudoflavonifractor capillosus ATCC 29799]